jgi:hypothetical protein
MVRLNRSTCDQRVRTLGQGIRHQELKLSRLVAATRQPEQVVALDEHVRRAKVLS